MNPAARKAALGLQSRYKQRFSKGSEAAVALLNSGAQNCRKASLERQPIKLDLFIASNPSCGTRRVSQVQFCAHHR